MVAYGSVEEYPVNSVGYSAPSASGYERNARSSSQNQVINKIGCFLVQIRKLSFQDEAPAEKGEWGYYPELQEDFNSFSFDPAASKLDHPVFSESRSSFVESPYMPALS